MSTYRLPERDELEAFLKACDLPLPDEVLLLGDGVSNSNLMLVTGRGRFVLTLYEQFGAEDMEAVLQLQQALNGNGFPCPAIVADSTGRLLGRLADRPAALFCYIEDDGRSLPAPAAVGELLARLHLAGQEISFERANPRGPEWMLACAERVRSSLDAADRSLIDEELDYLARHRQLALPSGIVHGDVFPDNLRIVDGEIRALIDFEFACREVLLFDVAVAIHAFCSRPDGSLDRLAMRDLLAAYVALRPISREENLAIPLMLRATALRFWLSRLEESLQPAEEGVLRKPPGEFRRILLDRRKPLSGMQY